MHKAYQYWLGHLPAFSNKKIQALINYFGSAYHVYCSSEAEYRKVKGLQEKDIRFINQHKINWNVDKEFEKIKNSGVNYITIEDSAYPERLKRLVNPPYALFVKGQLPFDHIPAVAVIGSRICSEYGKKAAREFSSRLALRGIQIISGMARGIDGISQKSAIDAGGMTFAVLGSGVDICYPKENILLYENILNKNGGIISQFPLGTVPKPCYFPVRNEIISGLADMILVIEAKEKSGSLITADLALEQGKEVFAVPGRVTDALSVGCNRLLKQGAGVALSAEDILEELGFFKEHIMDMSKKTNISLESKENMVYSCLDLYPKGLDAIQSQLNLSLKDIIQHLIALEMKGLIKEISQNYYVKLG